MTAPPPDLDGFLSTLVADGTLSSESLLRVRAAMATSNQPLDVVITELGLMREDELVRRLGAHLGGGPAALPRPGEPLPILATIGAAHAAAKAVLPLRIDDEVVEIAVADPFDAGTLEALAYRFDRKVTLVVALRADIHRLLEARPDQERREVDDILAIDDDLADEDSSRLADLARDAPVVALVARLAREAVDLGATDVHVEPLADRIVIRMRRDGLLRLTETVPKSLHAGLVTRIKILARLNIVERRLPQDGRMRTSVRGREVDFRVSIMPSIHGEAMVLRLLHAENTTLALPDLGFSPEACSGVERLAAHADGVVAVTGPTGSGKSTTLHAVVRRLAKPEIKIFTIEDPVEYRMDGITQLQVQPTIGLTFASALRAVLRHDPDVILVGEIRDRETAEIAVQAALTGHLVLTTLHTNSAVGAVTRLTDMGLDRFLVAATLRGVIAQRLVRRTCSVCRGQNSACSSCGGSGFAGRTVLHEILPLSPTLVDLISSGAEEARLLEAAQAEGMQTLAEHGESLVSTGITTRSEIARVIGEGVGA